MDENIATRVKIFLWKRVKSPPLENPKHLNYNRGEIAQV